MIKCECGKMITKNNKSKHKKTLKHIRWVNDEYVKDKKEYEILFKLKREKEYPLPDHDFEIITERDIKEN